MSEFQKTSDMESETFEFAGLPADAEIRNWRLPTGCVIVGYEAEAAGAAASSALGTYLLTITRAGTSLLDASFDLTSLVADVPQYPDRTGTGTLLSIQAGVQITITATSTNADLIAATGGLQVTIYYRRA